MKARAASPDVLVDLQDIEELRGVRDLGNGSVEVGAMTTYSQLIGDEAAGARSILGEVASMIADVQVRNRGARVAIGCVDAVPVRAQQMEERIGSDYSDASVRAAAEGLGATLDPPSD